MAKREKNFRSPSQIERLFQCPGSARAQEEVKIDLPHNEAAVEGTAIHDLAARCLKARVNASNFYGADYKIKYDGTEYDFRVNDDFVYCVNLYRNTILRILKDNGATEDALQIEAYDELPDVEVQKGKKFGGTSDCRFIAGSTLHIFDLKGGRGIIVDPKENKQLMSYAIRSVEQAGMFIDKVVLWIIQPRAKEGEYVKSWETTPEVILAFKEKLKEQIAKSHEKNAPLVTGPECGFCTAAGSCLALQKGIMVGVQKAVPRLDGKIFPVVRSLTPDQVGNALPSLYLLKEYLQTLEDYAFSLLMSGQEVPNFVLSKTKKHRAWGDEQAAIEYLKNHLQEDEFMTHPKLMTPAQVEKLVPKDFLKDYIVQPEGEFKIVMEKEAKDWVKRTAEEVFKNVELPQQ